MSTITGFKSKFNIQLNNQQEKVVNHIDGPGVVLAVAGAGKTTSIVSRVGNLILSHGVAPESIVTMTFSKASAKDMSNRFLDLFGNNMLHSPEFSTIHSFAYKIMNFYARKTGTSYNLIEEKAQSNQKISKYRVLRQIGLSNFNKYFSEDQLEELIGTIGFVKNMMIKDDEFIYYDITINNFKEIFNLYEKFKLENNLIDYDDMLTIAYDILLKNPNLLKGLQRKYNYIQVDEAQDTSPIQFEIIKLLASPKNNIVFVGDDDQSIYRFRGTKPEIMLNFHRHFNDAKVYFMEENFRSTLDIINLANPFIKENKTRFDKNIFTVKSELEKPQIIYSANEIEQVKFIIEKINSTPSFKSNAIIFRNNQSAIYIMNELNNHNLNFYVKDFKNKFFKHWITQDILNFVNVALDPTDINSFSTIYYKTNGYLSKEIIKYTKETLPNTQDNLFKIMLTYPLLNKLQRSNILKLQSNFNMLKNSNGNNFMKIIEYQLGYGDFLKKRTKGNGNSLNNVNNILGSFKLITEEIDNISEVKTKLLDLESLLKKSSFNKDSNITLTTAHSSKGLEYDNVYVIDIVEDIFPTFNSVQKATEEKVYDELEEERRLMYVAITRAKERLYLFSLANKNFNAVNKSIFLREIEKILNIKNDSNILNLSITSDIEHKKFGKGKVKDIEKNIALVSFKSGEKYIDLSICAQNNLLKIIKS